MNRDTKSTNTLEYKSLTSEPFLYKEMLEISKLIVEKKSKEEIKDLCINENYLQLTSKSAVERFMPSIMRRIEYLDEFLAQKIN